MLLKDIWDLFEEKIFERSSTDVLFNQYKDNISGLDLPDGAKIRKENLRNYLRGFDSPPQVLLIGEAAGPWGCRFSGIPFTSERQLVNGSLPFSGRQSSTHSPPYLETSSSIFWGLLSEHYPDFFICNVVPYHPHKKGLPLTIRRPNISEIKEFLEALGHIIAILNPHKVIAIGRVAEYALKNIGVKAIYVRHPSQSGASLFRKQMKIALSD